MPGGCGGLDVAKERFVAFPSCERAADGALVVTWAGYDRLLQARAIATWYGARKDEGWPVERLTPLLAAIQELLPWLMQWHNAFDPTYGLHMGEYFTEFLREEAKRLDLGLEAIRRWSPPARPTRRGPRRARGRAPAMG